MELFLELDTKLEPQKLGAAPTHQSRGSEYGSLLELLLASHLFLHPPPPNPSLLCSLLLCFSTDPLPPFLLPCSIYRRADLSSHSPFASALLPLLAAIELESHGGSMAMPPPLLVVLQSSAEEQGEATPPLGQWPLQRPVAEGSGPHDGCSSSALVGARPRLQPCWQISLSLSLYSVSIPQARWWTNLGLHLPPLLCLRRLAGALGSLGPSACCSRINSEQGSHAG